jgi:hypothetical protein
MSVFGFIENFFFISLALVFVLVLLLVYHFKTRITVAEKKSESMYGLLTAVVKEIKILRGMFGLGGTPSPSVTNPPSDNFEIKSKTTPEVDVPVLTHPVAQNNQISKQESVVFVADSDSAKKDAADIKEAEVIRLDFSAADNFTHEIDAYNASGRIVVSDDDDNDESSISEEDDSESESDSEFESESESDTDSYQEAQVQVFEIDVPASHLEPETTLTADVETVCLEEPDIGISELPEQNKPEETELPPQNNDVVEIKNLVENIVETVDLQQQPPQTPTVVTTIPPIEQLRKMNINQLKTIALQLGITADISKLKKPELISLIRERDE